MKPLITTNDIKKAAEKSDKTLYIEPGTLITPAARDTASELGVTITVGAAPLCGQTPCTTPAVTAQPVVQTAAAAAPQVISPGMAGAVDPEMIARIVQQVIASMAPGLAAQGPEKLAAPGGLRVIKGSTVPAERFDTGKPGDKVCITEVLSRKESPNLCTGFMSLEKTSFPWELGYDEVDYVIDGYIDMIVDGQSYRAEKGDILFIPMHSKVVFSAPEYVKVFFVTYPANWQDLSNKK